jgi:hypothetical protein
MQYSCLWWSQTNAQLQTRDTLGPERDTQLLIRHKAGWMSASLNTEGKIRLLSHRVLLTRTTELSRPWLRRSS